MTSFIASWGHTLTPVWKTADLLARWPSCKARTVVVCLIGLEDSRKCRYFTSRSPDKSRSWRSTRKGFAKLREKLTVWGLDFPENELNRENFAQIPNVHLWHFTLHNWTFILNKTSQKEDRQTDRDSSTEREYISTFCIHWSFPAFDSLPYRSGCSLQLWGANSWPDGWHFACQETSQMCWEESISSLHTSEHSMDSNCGTLGWFVRGCVTEACRHSPGRMSL